MADMTTQTMLRDLIFDDDSDGNLERVEFEDIELESNFAGDLIHGVIDNLSESSDFKQK